MSARARAHTHTHTHTHTHKYYSAIVKKETLPFATTWMDLVGIMLSEISQTEKDKFHIISIIRGKNPQQNDKFKLIDTKNRLVVARGGG